MEQQRNPLLIWAYYCQGKSIEELRQSLLLTTIELETVKARAQEELIMRDNELNHLQDLLSLAMRERDEAVEKCQKLLFENFLLQQQGEEKLTQVPPIQSNQTAPLSGTSSIEDEHIKGFVYNNKNNNNNNNNNDICSSESEDSTYNPPQLAAPPQLATPPPKEEELDPLVGDKPLPEQGKLLEAVMKAGPLLQTLLLAGPLPQWRHPPPPIHSHQIPPPPVIVPPLVFENSCGVIRKRGICEESDVCPTETKYQREFILH